MASTAQRTEDVRSARIVELEKQVAELSTALQKSDHERIHHMHEARDARGQCDKLINILDNLAKNSSLSR